MSDSSYFIGLDIGTTKICVVVLRKNQNGDMDVLGYGTSISLGLRKGVIVNIDATVKSIKEAVANAEKMSGITIKNVCAGVAGGHIKSINSKGVIPIKGKEVTQKDIERAIESAAAVYMPMGHEVIHVIPQQYVIDGQSEIKDPIGMSGVRLEMDVHIVTGAVSSVANITKACEKAGLVVDNIYLEQLASSEAVLTDEEREIGVALIDGGGGTTDMAIFKHGSVYDTAVLQLGGNNFTRDLATAISCSEDVAEGVKLTYGRVVHGDQDSSTVIEVAAAGGSTNRQVSLPVVTEVMELRASEMFELFYGELVQKKSINIIGAGIVLTGGIGNIAGIDHLVANITKLPVRIGKPRKQLGGYFDKVEGPQYSTGIGLALLHSKMPGNKKVKLSFNSNNSSASLSEEHSFQSVLKTMKSWFGEFF